MVRETGIPVPQLRVPDVRVDVHPLKDAAPRVGELFDQFLLVQDVLAVGAVVDLVPELGERDVVEEGPVLRVVDVVPVVQTELAAVALRVGADLVEGVVRRLPEEEGVLARVLSEAHGRGEVDGSDARPLLAEQQRADPGVGAIGSDEDAPRVGLPVREPGGHRGPTRGILDFLQLFPPLHLVVEAGKKHGAELVATQTVELGGFDLLDQLARESVLERQSVGVLGGHMGVDLGCLDLGKDMS